MIVTHIHAKLYHHQENVFVFSRGRFYETLAIHFISTTLFYFIYSTTNSTLICCLINKIKLNRSIYQYTREFEK